MDEAAEVLARHVSPDGELVFRVERESGIISFGFEGLVWHLHPDGFDARGRSPERVALDVVDDLISDRMVIVTEYEGGQLRRHILETVQMEIEFVGAQTRLEFRLWSGRPIDRSELLEGSVDYKPLGETWVTALTAAAPR